MMAEVRFPQILGINQLADETSLVEEEVMFVRSATNVDIDTAGNFSRRKGQTLRLSGSKYHSLYSSQRGWLMVCNGPDLGILDTDTYTFTALVTMADNYLLSYTEMNGVLYAMSPKFSCRFPVGSATFTTIGVPLPTVDVEFSVLGYGNFEEGTYGIAYTIVSAEGEESPLSDLVTLDLAAGQGILGSMFSVAAGYKYRVYVTTANGDVLHQAIEFDADTVSQEITVPEEGREPETMGMQLLEYGYTIRNHNSRLLVAAKDYVYFSEPFRPHLMMPSNYLRVTGFPTMMESVGTGVFIADRHGVRFYRGEDPTQWEEEEASPERAVYGTSIVLSGSFFDEELAQFDEVALWLSPHGYQLGLPTGEVLRLNASQVYIPEYSQGCVTTSVVNGRKQVITPVNSNLSERSGTALDSETI
jgi:hypothetical protein